MPLLLFNKFSACNGSFGNNCSSPCPDGYYGLGCRLNCICTDTQKCDPMIGCIHNGDHNGIQMCVVNYHVSYVHQSKFFYQFSEWKVTLQCNNNDWNYIVVEESSTPGFTMETKHIFLVVSSFCILVLFAGYAFYCVRRYVPVVELSILLINSLVNI